MIDINTTLLALALGISALVLFSGLRTMRSPTPIARQMPRNAMRSSRVVQ